MRTLLVLFCCFCAAGGLRVARARQQRVLKGQWTNVGNFTPGTWNGCAAAFADDVALTFGGEYYPGPFENNRVLRWDVGATSTVTELLPSSGTPPNSRRSANCIVVGGFFYVVGGFDRRDVTRFLPSTRQWQGVSTVFPHNIGSAGIAAYGADTFLVWGGEQFGLGPFRVLGELWEVKPAVAGPPTNITQVNAPPARWGLSFVRAGGGTDGPYFLFGGRDLAGAYKDLWQLDYDGTVATWQLRSSVFPGSTRYTAALAVTGGTIWAGLGYDPSGGAALGDIWTFDNATGLWAGVSETTSGPFQPVYAAAQCFLPSAFGAPSLFAWAGRTGVNVETPQAFVLALADGPVLAQTTATTATTGATTATTTTTGATTAAISSSTTGSLLTTSTVSSSATSTSSSSTGTDPVESSSARASSGVPWLFVGIGAGVCVICVAFVAVLLVLKRRQGNGKTNTNDEVVDLPQPVSGLATPGVVKYDELVRMTTEDGQNSVLGSGQQTPLLDKRFIIRVKDLEFGDELARGQFGVVYKGEYSGNSCVIKQLHSATEEAKDELVREGMQLAQIRNHASICAFYGVCIKPLCLVTEFIAGGNLGSFLLDRKSIIRGSDALNLAKDLAGGMGVLHASRLLHLDLAARNLLVLVHENPLKLRITDFGLSQTLPEGLKEIPAQKCQVPWRWSDPRVVLDRTFSKASDIWAFGVCLWEIMARKRPYDSIHEPHDVIQFTAGGGRLSKPDLTASSRRTLATSSTNDFLYDIMLNCWDSDVSARPKFRDLAKRIGAFIDQRESPDPSADEGEEDKGEYVGIEEIDAAGEAGFNYGSRMNLGGVEDDSEEEYGIIDEYGGLDEITNEYGGLLEAEFDQTRGDQGDVRKPAIGISPPSPTETPATRNSTSSRSEYGGQASPNGLSGPSPTAPKTPVRSEYGGIDESNQASPILPRQLTT